MHCIGSDEEDSQMADTQVKVGRTWEAVGPFPSGMREHPLMASPLSAFTFPGDADLDFALRPYDAKDSWPSELPTGGRVGWKRFEATDDGWLEVSYPEVNWDQLRLDRGWASLQYQVVLRTSLTVPAVSGLEETPLLVDLIQGTEFALIPKDRKPSLPVKWYQGDVYDFANFPAGRHTSRATSNFARGISVLPGEYVLVVRAMYEIRMFGDPGLGKGATIRLKFAAEVDTHRHKLEVLDGTAIVPDVVDGWLMGKAMSVGIRASSSRAKPARITGCSLDQSMAQLHFAVIEPTKIVPGMTRPIAFTIGQTAPLQRDIKSLTLNIHVDNEILTWTITLVHHTLDSGDAFKMTLASSTNVRTPLPASISYAMVVPPATQVTHEAARPPPVILALHGAGVDAQSQFWTDAIPRRPGGWAVLPTGRTEWGEDWHGGSMVDVWAARDALPDVIAPFVDKGSIPTETLLIGHSNGGQGAWHSAARNPDRITGLIAAAGYLKIQDYVPYTECFGDRYADPALMGILHAALAPYNNDLYASNLSGIPILAVHGAVDRNVTPRHSRAHAALVQAWQGEEKNNLVQVVEVPGEDHWWDEIFRLPEVARFIENLPPRKTFAEVRKAGFTLTTANVHETGTKGGIAIVAVKVPGRLARLDVNARQWRDRATSPLDMHGMNVKTIMLRNDGSLSDGRATELVLEHGPEGWQEVDRVYPAFLSRPQGPMIRLLATTAPLAMFIGTNPLHLSIATRIAHDLYTYHRIDTQIISPATDSTSLGPSTFEGNHLIIGRPEDNVWVKALLAESVSQIDLSKPDSITFNGRFIDEKGVGLLALQKHLHSETALAALLTGTDDEGLELAARLFPLRTGVPVPEWAIVSPRAKWQGPGGLIGAGFWDREWKWSECMSWMDR